MPTIFLLFLQCCYKLHVYFIEVLKHCTCWITRYYLLLSRVQWLNVSTYIHYTKQDFQPTKNILQPLQNEHTRGEIYFRFYGLLPTTYTPCIYILIIARSIYTHGTRTAVYEFLPLQNRNTLQAYFSAVLRTFLRTCRLSPCCCCYILVKITLYLICTMQR